MPETSESAPHEAAGAARGLIEEANQRLTALGWPVRVLPSPHGARSVELRATLAGSLGRQAQAEVALRSTDMDEAVGSIVAEVIRRGWDRSMTAPPRLARRAVWCEPI